ncbi:MAG TPA: glycosyltransferase family 4 protein [Vicinamibacterales bacterium]
MQFIYHHRTAGRGGEGVHITSVVRALLRGGHAVTLVSPPGVDPLAPAADVPLDKDMKGIARPSGISRLWKWLSCSCPQFVFELAEIAYNAYALVTLPRRLRGREPRVYYERYAFFMSAGVWVAKWYGRPVILEVNEVTGIQRARAQKLLRLSRWFERQTFSRADEIITVSSFLQREVLQRGGRPGHVHVVPNAIDPARFQHADGRAVRARLGLGDATVVGFAGWFDRWDRLDRLVAALGTLRQTHGDVRLLLVGDGPVAHELREAIARAGLEPFTTLTGPVPRAEVPSYLDAMDICVLPDSNEFGSPIVLFEFMALGKAIIGPDVAPVRDVIRPGENGWIVNQRNGGDLTAAIGELVADPALRTRMGLAARRQALADHTWDAVAIRVESLAAAHLGTASPADIALGAA